MKNKLLAEAELVFTKMLDGFFKVTKSKFNAPKRREYVGTDTVIKSLNHDIRVIVISNTGELLMDNYYKDMSDIVSDKREKSFSSITDDWVSKNHKMEQKLKDNLFSGKLILTGEEDRGVGKTNLLIKYARKHVLPILVPNKIIADRVRKKEEIMVLSLADDLRGLNATGGFLVDEGIKREELNSILKLGVKINTGFYYDPLLTK